MGWGPYLVRAWESPQHCMQCLAGWKARGHGRASWGRHFLPLAVVLGIESSCDDTGIAVVTDSGRVLGESLVGQADIHAPWGGVVPKLAQKAHEAAINSCVEEALAQAGLTPNQLDAVAVTVGPGLSLCLRVSPGALLSCCPAGPGSAASCCSGCPTAVVWLLTTLGQWGCQQLCPRSAYRWNVGEA